MIDIIIREAVNGFVVSECSDHHSRGFDHVFETPEGLSSHINHLATKAKAEMKSRAKGE